ncbi:MAG: zinc ribbon domain-containing protein [Deltaproteobacteria bacterium]|nr:zinc ribbon domain-containing protein [Deltaproteobacteria bacterium]
MPTYEYRCHDCGRRFEVSQKISAAKLTVCEVCGGRLERLISGGTGFITGAAGGSRAAEGMPACGRSQPCCGRDQACGDDRPCRVH